MSKAYLPQVTLVLQETRNHVLARLAIEECLRHCEFGEVVVVSDQFNELRIAGAHYVRVEDWPDKLGWSRFHWYGTAPLIPTTHALFIQWDSWVLDGAMWSPKFLEYDFIGAPWQSQYYSVGNGGFSLKSRDLVSYVSDHRDEFPIDLDCDDDLVSRAYRHELMRAGFTWAPPAEALDFAFERVRRAADSKHFGYHGTFNWPWIMPYEHVVERMSLLNEGRHRGMLWELHAMVSARARGLNPWLAPSAALT